jgi:hypothetical protein
MGWKDGVSFQSAAAKKTRPAHTASAQEYSIEENTFLFNMEATIIVGMSLQDRKTTFVGKLM